MKTIEELEAELETVTRERDKLAVLAELSDGYRRERDEVRAEADMLQDRLSESRAEVERLADERDELLVRVADQGAELRATRDAYIGAKWTNTYRRGAEAMREACEAAIHAAPTGAFAELVIRALPIPEEP